MDRHALERLGHHVVSRRVALGYRNRTDLADSLQFTVRTLADIEHGVRKASPGTYAMLENKLAWAPGSIDTILAGGEPQELVVKQRRTTRNPLSRHRHRRHAAASPPRSCCWSYGAASSPPATDATTPGTTGAALTRTATGPTRASSQHLIDPLPTLMRFAARTPQWEPSCSLSTITPLNDGDDFCWLQDRAPTGVWRDG